MTALKKQPEGGGLDPRLSRYKKHLFAFFPAPFQIPPCPSLLLHHPRTPEGGVGSPTFAL